ncbi:MAG: 6,7-dimethyl-8-ribityllumazine synthase [Rhodospirillales bacterium]
MAAPAALPVMPPVMLFVEAPYYAGVVDDLREGARAVCAEAGFDVQTVQVPGVFEIPAACALAWEAGGGNIYAGIIALGCVIRGETDHYDHICREASRALMDLAVVEGVPLGFGVLTCENETQARVRADPKGKNKGAEAAKACLAMIALHNKFAEVLEQSAGTGAET